MLKLQRIFKNYEETGSLSEQINLYGFIGPEVFLTKSGETGIVLEVKGVDFECLDRAAIDGLTKRLESALRLFDENCRVYQYLFKRKNVDRGDGHAHAKEHSSKDALGSALAKGEGEAGDHDGNEGKSARNRAGKGGHQNVDRVLPRRIALRREGGSRQ